jgi:hypothetical protein
VGTAGDRGASWNRRRRRVPHAARLLSASVALVRPYVALVTGVGADDRPDDHHHPQATMSPLHRRSRSALLPGSARGSAKRVRFAQELRIRRRCHEEAPRRGPHRRPACSCPLVFRSFLALSLARRARGDTPVTGGSWISRCEEDSIDCSCTVLVRVIRRCLPAPPHRARWPVCLPCSARALPPRHSLLSSGWSSA